MWRRVEIVAAAVLVAATLGACSGDSSDDDGGDRGGGGSATTGGGGVSPGDRTGGEALPDGLQPIEGVVALFDPLGADTSAVLQVHDPQTGAITQAIPLPHTDAPATAPFGDGFARQFDSDWVLYTWSDGGSVHVARRVPGDAGGEMFEEFAQWDPQQTFDQATSSYHGPSFNPSDGRIWFERRSQGEGGGGVMSVDPERPEEPPRDEEPGDATLLFDSQGRQGRSEQVTLPGPQDGATLDLTRTDTEPVEGQIRVWGLTGQYPAYVCPFPDGERLLCVAMAGEAWSGSVAAVVVGHGGEVSLEEVVRAPVAPPLGGVVSPDRTQALIHVDVEGWNVGEADGNWFLADLTTGQVGAEPVFAALERSEAALAEPTPVAWL
jgi:hypothetical protein